MNARRGIAALAVTLALGACAAGEKPAGALPQLTSTPTTTTTVVPSVSPFPATKQGAADFVRRYLEVGNTVEATGQVNLLMPLFQPSCETCRKFVATMRKYYEDGRIVGGQVSVRFVETALADDVKATVTADVASAGGRIYDSAGKLLKSIPPVRGSTLLFRLVRVGEGWQVASYGVSS